MRVKFSHQYETMEYIVTLKLWQGDHISLNSRFRLTDTNLTLLHCVVSILGLVIT